MNDEIMLLTVPEAARVLRISRNLAYELVARGEIPAIRLGRVIRVPRAPLEEWVKSEAAPPPHRNPDGVARVGTARLTGGGEG